MNFPMNETRRKQEHEEIDLLLPWYVNATLGPAEHDRVAGHVASCSECRQSVSELRALQVSVARDKATPIVPRPRVNDLLDAIEKRSGLHQLDRRQALGLAVAALVTLTLVATVFISNLDRIAGTPVIFEPATSEPVANNMDYVLRIQFGADTNETERERVLQDIGARDISGGSVEGSYRVVVQLSAASLEELDRYTDNLEAMPAITSVEVLALQLPMKSRQ